MKNNYELRITDDKLRAKKIVFCLIFVCHLLFVVHHLFAAFDEFLPGARPAALGGAFVAIADDANTVFYNPAGLSRIKKNEILASYGQLHPGLSDNSNISNSIISYVNSFGKYGVAGLGIYSLSVSGLYSEKVISFSYGIKATPKLGVGLTMKSLLHKYGSDDYMENAIDNYGNSLGIADPVFINGKSKSKLSSDFGIFYRYRSNYNLAFVIQNIGSPNIGLYEADMVPKVFRLGFAHTSKASNMLVEVLSKSNDISNDTSIISGFEKYFFIKGLAHTTPASFMMSLLGRSKKVFVFRGAMVFGSNSLRQLSLGVGHSRNNYKIDYAFVYPLVGISDTYGTHKISVAVLFNPLPL
ncbi:MAG: hypothetical protein ABID79_02690 [Elusimicrobiota bacterium]